jgi:hypothetical protein
MFVPYVPSGGESCGTTSPRLVRKLLAEGATSQWSAKPLSPTRRIEQRALERAVRTGIIRRTDEGAYWVDQERWDACRAKQARFAVIAVFGVLLMFAILFVLGEFP